MSRAQKPTLLFSCGRPASGKTMACAQLEKTLMAVRFEVGSYKLLLKPDYQSRDEQNEGLRDRALAPLTKDISKQIKLSRNIVVDGVFATVARRRSLLDSLNTSGYQLILLYCFCPDIKETESRIARRDSSEFSDAGICAKSMEDYYHSDSIFENPYRAEFSSNYPDLVIYEWNTQRFTLSCYGGHIDLDLEQLLSEL